MRVIPAVWMLLVVSGCGGGYAPPPGPAAYPDGLYRFVERAEGVTTTLSGLVRLAGDSFDLVESSPACLRESYRDRTYQPGVVGVTFNCGEIGLAVGYRAGKWELGYGASRQVKTTKQVCERYEQAKDGRQVCARYRTDTDYSSVPVRGKIRLLPAESTRDTTRVPGPPSGPPHLVPVDTAAARL